MACGELDSHDPGRTLDVSSGASCNGLLFIGAAARYMDVSCRGKWRCCVEAEMEADSEADAEAAGQHDLRRCDGSGTGGIAECYVLEDSNAMDQEGEGHFGLFVQTHVSDPSRTAIRSH